MDLDKRFQQIIPPYFSDIDLSEVSSKEFNTFMKDIALSKQDYNICSLALKNSGQFKQIFYPQGRQYYVNLFKMLSKNILHIPALKLTIDHSFHENDLLWFALPQLSFMSKLTDLHLNILSDASMENIFPRIFEHLPSTLTKLTILGSWKKSTERYQYLGRLQLPSRIKSFAFSTHDLKTIYETRFLQETTNNVEELKISFDEFDYFKDEYSNLQFPTSLITLHLELTLIELEVLAKFLKCFTNQLKALILIIRTTFNLENELKNMIKDIFPELETFKYTIYSPNEITTSGHPPPSPFSEILKSNFDTIMLNFGDRLDFSTINLLNLRKLIYRGSSPPDNSNDDEISMLNSLFLTSPNLKCLKLTADNSDTFIDLLKLIPTKNITKLECDISDFDELFLIDLAQIMPHIRELSLKRVHFKKSLEVHRGNKKICREVLTTQTAIEHVQLYHKNLIHLYLYMASFVGMGSETYKEHKQLEQWLKNKNHEKKFYSIYSLHSSYDVDSPWENDDESRSSEYWEYCLYVSP